MESFRTHRGSIATLDRANVDTDQIIAKQFLKSIKRTGFGEDLFHDWRYLPDGSANADFSLNRAEFEGASVLVVRNNFGCGSSREHAVWAVLQAGYRVVVAPAVERDGGRIPGFADIFRNNAEKNGLLPVELSDDEVEEIFQLVDRFGRLEATVDLDEQRLVLHLDEEVAFGFEVDAAVKHALVHGLDDIGQTLEHESAITDYEKSHPVPGV